ncbi:hypothetical protein C8A01DRAFT_34358 [Parachaetomium inaequale]|uniref:Uncharacterized protein n=1 Tax=Parachaetomium inaequale TaxID=2588326 RepID=A0AAN6STP1_9PEZI|nr:hypothetical protein C8A01DRAFT_34358 [Parachaetomium inaequale]
MAQCSPASNFSSADPTLPAKPIFPIRGPNPTPSPTSLSTQSRASTRSAALLTQTTTTPVYESDLRWAAFGGGVGWLLENFPKADGFIHWPLAVPRDIEYACADEEEGGETVRTIPEADAMLWHIAKHGKSTARDAEGRKQVGIVCIALLAAPPAPVVGTPRLAEGSAAGTPAMEAAEKALLAYIKELQDVGTPEVGPTGVLVERCMAVVFMGCDKSVYEFEKQRGFFDPQRGVEFAEPRSKAAVNHFPGTEGVYLFPHHAKEIERLRAQHALILSSTGGILVTAPLKQSKIKVLDCGAADGTWLLDLPRLYPEHEWSLHGVDIGTALFPPKAGPYASLDLREFDLRSPVPPDPSWDQSFDLVHQRLLILALKTPYVTELNQGNARFCTHNPAQPIR